MAGRIIDADTHIIETPPIWEHLTAAERQHKPKAIELDEGIMVPPVQRPMTSVWIIDGQLYARTNLDALGGRVRGQVERRRREAPPPRPPQVAERAHDLAVDQRVQVVEEPLVQAVVRQRVPRAVADVGGHGPSMSVEVE